MFIKSSAVIPTAMEPVSPASDAEFLFPDLSWVRGAAIICCEGAMVFLRKPYFAHLLLCKPCWWAQTMPVLGGNRSGFVFEDDGDSSAYAASGAPGSLSTSLEILDTSPSAMDSQISLELRLTATSAAGNPTESAPNMRKHQFVFPYPNNANHRGSLDDAVSFSCDGVDSGKVPGAFARHATGADAVAATGNYICAGSEASVAPVLVVSCGEWPTSSGSHVVELQFN